MSSRRVEEGCNREHSMPLSRASRGVNEVKIAARLYFPHIFTLAEFARVYWPERGLHRPGSPLLDPTSRLSQILIGFRDDSMLPPPPACAERGLRMQSDVVSEALVRLFFQQGLPRNVICGGYSATGRGFGSRSTGLDNTAPSTAVTLLKSPDFETLLEEIGVVAMEFIVRHSCLLLPVTAAGGSSADAGVGSTSFYQFLGAPPGKLFASANGNHHRHNNSNPGGEKPVASRRNIMYCRRSSVGLLRHGSPLHKCTPSKHAAKRLLSDIFCASTLPENKHRKPRRSPRARLKGQLANKSVQVDELLLEFLERLNCKPLMPVLDKYCPIPTADRGRGTQCAGTGEDTDTELSKEESSRGFMQSCTRSEESEKIICRQQQSTNSMTTKSDPHEGVPETRPPRKRKREHLGRLSMEQLVSGFTDAKAVSKFLYSLCAAVLPRALIGCDANWQELGRCIDSFTSRRLYEQLHIGAFADRMKVNDLIWTCSTENSGTLSPGDLQWRKARVRDLMHWLFGTFFTEVVTTQFYCTETEPTRLRRVYYRRALWGEIHRRAAAKLASSALRRIDRNELEEISRSRRRRGLEFAYADLRWLPKAADVRALQIARIQSTNPGVANAHNRHIWKCVTAILHYELCAQPGASVLSMKEVYSKVLAFKRTWQKSNRPRMFCAKYDVAKSFDTINLKKLVMDVIPSAVKREDYVVVQYTVYTSRNRRDVYGKKKMIVSDVGGSAPNFLRLVREQLCRRHRNAIIVDDVKVSIIARKDVLQMLSHILRRNVLHVDGFYHVQTNGVAQGMPLSTILASLYYARMASLPEMQITGGEGNDGQPHMEGLSDSQSSGEGEVLTLNMRFVDDFFFASSSHRLARRFARNMGQGVRDFNTTVNAQKSSANFGGVGATRSTIPWCGLSVDTVTMEVLVDFAKFRSCRIRDTLTIHLGPDWKPICIRRLRALCLNVGLSALHIDRRINSKPTIARNVHQVALLTALRALIYMQEVRNVRRLPDREAETAFKSCIRCVRASLVTKLNRLRRQMAAPAEYEGPELTLTATQFSHIVALGLRDMVRARVSDRNRCWVQPVLEELRTETSSARSSALERELGIELRCPASQALLQLAG
mmetsp:Transcript_4674/g.14125  ORF Transcript_4674/g.14125 Transcript_4674/m.14125 type:complete len:1110 (-) Transcript_4674:490-3819(-)